MPPTFTDEGLRAALWSANAGLTRRARALPVCRGTVCDRTAVRRPQGVGYLLKDRVRRGEFLDALGRVAEGGSALDPEVVAQLLARSRHPLGDLTPREPRCWR